MLQTAAAITAGFCGGFLICWGATGYSAWRYVQANLNKSGQATSEDRKQIWVAIRLGPTAWDALADILLKQVAKAASIIRTLTPKTKV